MNSQQEDHIREDETYNHHNAHQKKGTCQEMISKAAEQMNEQGIVSSEDRNDQAKVPDSLAGFLNKS